MRARKVVSTNKLGNVTLLADVRRFDTGIEMSVSVDRATLDALGEKYGVLTPMLFGAVPAPAGGMSASQVWSGSMAETGDAKRIYTSITTGVAAAMQAAVTEINAYDGLVNTVRANANATQASLESALQAGASTAGWNVIGD